MPQPTTPTPQQIAKLPAWARKHIKTVEMQQEAAVRALKGFTDTQTESPISFEDHECIGGSKGPTLLTRYIQARAVVFKWKGIELRVQLREDGPQWEDCISLQWSAECRGQEHVPMIPQSFQSIALIAKENLR